MIKLGRGDFVRNLKNQTGDKVVRSVLLVGSYLPSSSYYYFHPHPTRRTAAKPDTLGAKIMYGCDTIGPAESQCIQRHHRHAPSANQCSSALVKHIKSPVPLVWSLVRRFDEPQRYKPFVKQCVMRGDMAIGSIREVDVKSGLPATWSTERLEMLDDEEHILRVKIVGGDHRLRNYSSIITLHPETIEGRPGTLVVESFVVDVPEGNTKEETCCFVEALIKCNLKTLCDVSERMAALHLAEAMNLASQVSSSLRL